jgi:hypothetical protein
MTNFSKYITSNVQAFTLEANAVASRLGCTLNQLFGVMYIESRLNPKAQNKYTNATGLIQFMPATARGLGTTVEHLLSLTNVQQLYYVEKYLKPYKGRLHNVYDLYFAVFFPVAIGKPDSFIMQSASLSPAIIARQNPMYDINKDGKITVKEVKTIIDKILI